MKKLSALVLAFALAVPLGLPAFADDAPPAGTTVKNDGTNSTSITVQGIYQPGAAAGDSVIYVDIAWDAMDFTYTAPSKGDWDPESHTYKGTAETGGWAPTNGTAPKITVTNHSNINITADFAFEAADGVNVRGGFSSFPATFQLRSAEDTTLDNPPLTYATFYISSDSAPITESKDIGTITVAIKKGETTNIDDETALLNLNLTTPSVVLTQNITLTQQLSRNLFSGILDLAGHTLTSNVNDDEGSIVFVGGNSYLEKGYPITIKNGTITGSAKRLLHFGQNGSGAVDVTMKNCTINTTAADSGNDFAVWVDGGAILRLQDCTINSAGAVGLNVVEGAVPMAAYPAR